MEILVFSSGQTFVQQLHNNAENSDRTLLFARKDYSTSSFAHSNERLTAFFQPL